MHVIDSMKLQFDWTVDWKSDEHERLDAHAHNGVEKDG